MRDKEPKKTRKMSDAEQGRLFVETARKLGVDETETGHDKALGKVGLKKAKKKAVKK